MQPEQTKHYDLILIRHARSTFNAATIQVSQELGISGHWEDYIQHKQFNQKVSYNLQYVDAPLSPQGIQQCKLVSKQLRDIPFDLIIVSPYRRALETCRRLFPGIETRIPVIVEPLVSEIYRYSCDVTAQLQAKVEQYVGYDFSKVKVLGEDFALPNLPQHMQDRVYTKFQERNPSTLQEKQKILLQSLADNSLFESAADFRERVKRIKAMLTDYKQKYAKIAVISHYHTIGFLKSRGFRADGRVIDLHEIMNCYPYFEELEELKKIN